MTDFMTPIAETHHRARLKPWYDEARALGKLAAPLIAMQLAQMGSITADVIMVGSLGKEALAATSIGAVMFYFAWLGGYGPVMAISPIVSQILGAHPNDRARARAAVRMGLWAVAFISLPLMTFLIWTRPVLLALGQKPEIVAMAAPWTHIVALGLPFALGFGVLRNFASSVGRQNAVLAISVVTLLVNIALNYVLIFGHFGAPAMGVLGAATASAFAYTFSFVTMLGVILWAPAFRKYHLLHRFRRADWAKFREIFRLGAPMGMSMIFEAMLFNSATLIMGTFGAASVAANQIALNIGSLTFMVPLGIGLAATVRVGLAAGGRDGEGARLAGYTAMICGAGFVMLCAVIIALVPEALVSLYIPVHAPENEDVVRLAVSFLYVVAIFQLFDALQVTGQMSLRGLKDANAPMWIAGLSYWLVGFTLAWGLAFWAGMQGMGVWIGLASGLAAAAFGMVLRFEILSRRPL
jgi:MATE family multidrug resistance protein